MIPRFLADDELLDLLSRCTASVYLPIDEDTYGYVCYEAAMSGKPTVTCSDSGGALTLVEDGVSGLVAAPEPEAVGGAFARMLADPSAAAAMGQRASATGRGARPILGARDRGADPVRIALLTPLVEIERDRPRDGGRGGRAGPAA